MKLLSWLRPLAARWQRTRVRRAPQQLAVRLRVEELEDRLTPSLTQISDILAAPGSNGSGHLVPVGSWLYFAGDNGNGSQVWRTNGQPGGATQVDSGGQPLFDEGLDPVLVAAGPYVYFFTDDGGGNYSLWRNDSRTGTSQDLTPQHPLTVDVYGTTPYALTAVGQDVYFAAEAPASVTPDQTDWGVELWKCNGATGATGATAPFKDILPGPDGSYPSLASAGSTLYYAPGNGPDTDAMFGITDSTTGAAVAVAGASHVPPLQPAENGFGGTVTIGSDLYLLGDGISRISSPTARAQDIVDLPFDQEGVAVQSFGHAYTVAGSTIYFVDQTSDTAPIRLWKYDGTALTLLKSGLFPDNNHAVTQMAVIGSDVYFTGVNEGYFGHVVTGDGVWKYNGTTGAIDTVVSFDPSLQVGPTLICTEGSTLYYSAGYDPQSGQYEVWQTDGSGPGELVPNLPGAAYLSSTPGVVDWDNSAVIGSTVYFQDDGIWRVDDPFSQAGMQNALDSQPPVDPTTGNPTVVLQGNIQAQADDFVSLFQAPGTPGFTPLQPPAGATGPVDIVVNLASGVQFNEASLVIPQGIRVQINGGTWLGGSPALTFFSGDLTITGATFLNSTNAPTILVSGGHLTLRNDLIQESTAYNQAAIQVTGGTVDLGTAAEPGHNIINVNGAGEFVHNTTANPITAAGDTFELSVTVNSSLMLAGKSPPPLTGFVNGTPFTGSITYTTVAGDQVTVTLGTTATSGSGVNQYAILATLSAAGANKYVINPATSTNGIMYVVSVGADPTSTTGAQAVTFWDNKGNAKLITAADLSSLDVLNLVTQGGSAFDPKSVQQLQSWLSISPNATTAYQLAVQLAAMDLNVLAGYVKTTDLVYAGALLPYAAADNIAGLTSGGFIDVQDLMQAANAALGQVNPGAPANDANQAYESALVQVLQAANGNNDFVQQDVLWNLLALYPLLPPAA
jgi:ELWxxDGT repeat protein